jgi:hypothetical protein
MAQSEPTGSRGADAPDLQPFRAPWGGDDGAIASRLISSASLSPEAEGRIDA